MTTRLYYNDSLLCEFSAQILETIETENGTAITLDQTAYYPTSGGQPHDTGDICGIPVSNVWEDDEKRIWHLLERLPKTQGVTGRVNWSRRFDHMQQHTGQHILSASFHEKLDANTVGFHMSRDYSTIDLDTKTIAASGIHRVEEYTNKIVWENRPVKTIYINDDEVDKVSFRKLPQVSGLIRVIRIDSFDASACGGTHVKNTGEVGLTKITGYERHKGGLRISFLCGNRALKDYQRIQNNIQKVSRALSIHPDELPTTFTRMQDEATINRRILNKTREELLVFEADHLWKETSTINGIKQIIAFWEDKSSDEMRIMAKRLREHPKTFVLMAAIQDNNIRLLCTRSHDLNEPNADYALKLAAQKLGGKGGGSSDMANGGAPISDHKTVIDVLQQTIQAL